MKTPKPKIDSPNEFSRFMRMDALPREGAEFTLEAKTAECEAIAARLDLIKLDHFKVFIQIKPLKGERLFVLSGEYRTHYAQACVLTGQEIAQKMTQSFIENFCKYPNPNAATDDFEEPEPLEDGGIDFGEVALQNFSLDLDPSPRLQGKALKKAVANLDAKTREALAIITLDEDE